MFLWNFLSRLRYNYYVALFNRLVFSPVYGVSHRFALRIQSAIKVNGATVTYGGLPMKFPKNVGVRFLSNIYWKKEAGFEPLVFQVISRLTPKTQVFLDIGSHFGWYSVVVQKLNPLCRTFCFEPIPELFSDNHKFHQANNTNNQTILHYALSDKPGRSVIHMPSQERVNEVSSASMETNFFYNKKFPSRSVEIECVTLDEQLRIFRQEWSDLIMLAKIDVEGHECAVLEGGKYFLAACRPWLVVEIDTGGERVHAMIKLMGEINYDFFAIVKEGLFKIHPAGLLGFPRGHNFVLVPSEKRVDLYVSWQHLASVFSTDKDLQRSV
jgi:FkbM family methyltransferase